MLKRYFLTFPFAFCFFFEADECRTWKQQKQVEALIEAAFKKKLFKDTLLVLSEASITFHNLKFESIVAEDLIFIKKESIRRNERNGIGFVIIVDASDDSLLFSSKIFI